MHTTTQQKRSFDSTTATIGAKEACLLVINSNSSTLINFCRNQQPNKTKSTKFGTKITKLETQGLEFWGGDFEKYRNRCALAQGAGETGRADSGGPNNRRRPWRQSLEQSEIRSKDERSRRESALNPSSLEVRAPSVDTKEGSVLGGLLLSASLAQGRCMYRFIEECVISFWGVFQVIILKPPFNFNLYINHF